MFYPLVLDGGVVAVPASRVLWYSNYATGEVGGIAIVTDTSSRPLLREVSLVPETASDSAVRFLRALIFSGELRPGDRLPPERDLGARLGISRMTLRLALKALESTGYIVTTRGSHGGSRVSDPDTLFRCWEQWMREHSDELEDIFEFRTTVETRMAALAAKNHTPEDLVVMEAAIVSEEPPKDWSVLFRADMDFHIAVAQAAGSPRLERAMLSTRGELFVPVDIMNLDAKQPRVHSGHQAILEAIRARDSTKAADAMRRHVWALASVFSAILCGPALLAAEPHVYYVSASRGRDSNDGTTPETAWLTLTRVNTARLEPGDCVLFERGGSWRGQLVPASGREGAPVRYGAYGSGPLPRILGSVGRSRPHRPW